MDPKNSTLHEAMQKSLGESTSWADRRKLTQAIFTHIKGNLFPKNDYKWGERKQGEEGIYAEPEMTLGEVDPPGVGLVRTSDIIKKGGKSFSERLKLRDKMLREQESEAATFLRKVAEDEAIENSLGIPKAEANRLYGAITEGKLTQAEVSPIVSKYVDENGKLMIEKMSEADYMMLFASHGGEGWRETMHRRYLRLQK